MFSFIDSASDHAAALSHFHSYAMFFLIFVIIFVVWLLKLVLKFSVSERDLRKTSSETFLAFIPHFNFFVWTATNLLSFPPIRQFSLDFFSILLIVKNTTKTYYSYGLLKTIYPDQGEAVNVYSIFPQLALTSKEFHHPYDLGLITSQVLAGQHEWLTSIIGVFRRGKHNIPAIFPYERVEINSHGPYSSVEEFLTLDVYISSYILLLKFLVQAEKHAPHHILTHRWDLVPLDQKEIFGFAKFSRISRYKKYSLFVLPYSLFMDFYSNDLRTLFYLFFQQVRHRKVLEWIWTCVPALILLLLLYPSLILLYCYDRPYITKPYLTFKAIGHQWYWSYEYSDFVTSTEDAREHIKFDSYMLHEDDLALGTFRLLEVDRRIVLPIGVCMRLITTSSDVLHSWAVPALGVKIDAVPGRLNQFWIVADRPGTFYGQCSELCGVNHGFMPIAVEGAPFLEFFKAIAAAENF